MTERLDDPSHALDVPTPRTDAVYCPEFGTLIRIDTEQGYEHACQLERETVDLSMRLMRKAEHAADWQERAERAEKELSARSAGGRMTPKQLEALRMLNDAFESHDGAHVRQAVITDTDYRLLYEALAEGTVGGRIAQDLLAQSASEPLSPLADAVLAYDAAIHGCANDPEKMASFCTAQGDDLDALYLNMVNAAHDAKEKATMGVPDSRANKC